MDPPKFIVSNQKEESIHTKRVNGVIDFCAKVKDYCVLPRALHFFFSLCFIQFDYFALLHDVCFYFHAFPLFHAFVKR